MLHYFYLVLNFFIVVFSIIDRWVVSHKIRRIFRKIHPKSAKGLFLTQIKRMILIAFRMSSSFNILKGWARKNNHKTPPIKRPINNKILTIILLALMNLLHQQTKVRRKNGKAIIQHLKYSSYQKRPKTKKNQRWFREILLTAIYRQIESQHNVSRLS